MKFRDLKILINLANNLDSKGLYKEADSLDSIIKYALDFIPKVYMHIDGPSGAGKTTLMNKIKKLNLNIAIEDLDEFDDQASKNINLPQGWKQDSWDEFKEEFYEEKQRILEKYIKENNKKKIILVGINNEGDKSLKFNADHKILIDTKPEEALERRIRRDKSLIEKGHKGYQFWEREDDLKSELQESIKIVEDLKNNNYIPMSPEDILNFIREDA